MQSRDSAFASNFSEKSTFANSAWLLLISSIAPPNLEFSALTSASDSSNTLFSSLIASISILTSFPGRLLSTFLEFDSAVVESNFSFLLKAYAAVTEAAAAAAAGDCKILGRVKSVGLGLRTKTWRKRAAKKRN